MSEDSATFVAAYSGLITAVWSNPAKEQLLTDDPAALVAEYGIALPEGVVVTVARDLPEADPNLEVQVREWRDAPTTGTFTLYVPSAELTDGVQLDESELDTVVGGLDASCSCCCPCCCT